VREIAARDCQIRGDLPVVSAKRLDLVSRKRPLAPGARPLQ